MFPFPVRGYVNATDIPYIVIMNAPFKHQASQGSFLLLVLASHPHQDQLLRYIVLTLSSA